MKSVLFFGEVPVVDSSPIGSEFTLQVVLILLCVVAIGYALGWLTSHGVRNFQRWRHDRAEAKRRARNRE